MELPEMFVQLFNLVKKINKDMPLNFHLSKFQASGNLQVIF